MSKGFLHRSMVHTAAAFAIALAIDGHAAPLPLHRSAPVDASAARRAARSGLTATDAVEHRYRVVGKVRLAFFWSPGRDIGNARMTWHGDEHGSTVALLGGSDPARAPKRLNEWGYLREEVRTDEADVFMMRSATAAERAQRLDDAAENQAFAANCTSIVGGDVRTVATTAPARNASVKTIDRLLAQLVSSRPDWDTKRLDRPPDVLPGFLTALTAVIQAAAASRPAASVRPVAYLYNGTVYDLSIRERRPLDHVTVGEREFDRLTRIELAIRNRKTKGVTRFAVTYAPDAEPTFLPVQIFYQPNFWLSVEISLDDSADVPDDPATSASALTHIRQICAANVDVAPN